MSGAWTSYSTYSFPCTLIRKVLCHEQEHWKRQSRKKKKRQKKTKTKVMAAVMLTVPKRGRQFGIGHDRCWSW